MVVALACRATSLAQLALVDAILEASLRCEILVVGPLTHICGLTSPGCPSSVLVTALTLLTARLSTSS